MSPSGQSRGSGNSREVVIRSIVALLFGKSSSDCIGSAAAHSQKIAFATATKFVEFWLHAAKSPRFARRRRNRI
jgi:hypothetical protein